jgi:hypothetical protein
VTSTRDRASKSYPVAKTIDRDTDLAGVALNGAIAPFDRSVARGVQAYQVFLLPFYRVKGYRMKCIRYGTFVFARSLAAPGRTGAVQKEQKCSHLYADREG